ncbi:MAG: DUF1761 domain-containing protein [Bacteroidetes bacterium]|jgi:hypothetical protein|nr:DUF1761 domain-containing protein [Bacteroidota bacterium]
MNIGEAFQYLNWLAVICAALSTFLIGGLWYSVFEKPWMAVNNFTKDYLMKRKMPVVFAGSLLLALLMALNLALFIGKEDLTYGMIAGFMTGFGWVSFSIAIISLFENRPLTYVLINGGYMTVSFTVMGAIIGGWN